MMTINRIRPDWAALLLPALKIGLLVAIILSINLAGNWLAAQVNFQVWPQHMQLIEMMWLGMLLTYILLMLLPFVPGIEIGLILMMMLGDGGIVLVYLATQVALSLSFILGRCVPLVILSGALRRFGLRRASELIAVAGQHDCENRGHWLAAQLGNRYLKWLLKYRCATLGMLINLPGNAFIGGAGGIGLLAGSTGLICYKRFVLTMALATSPVPVLMLVFGVGQ